MAVQTETQKDVMNFLIKRNSRLPASFLQTDLLSCENQMSVGIRIFEGEHGNVTYNNFLGKFTLRGITPGKPVCVEGTLDTNGILTIKAKDVVSGTSSGASINVTSHYALTDDEIRLTTERLEKLEQMFAEAEIKIGLKDNLQSLCNNLTSLVNEEPNVSKEHAEAVEAECQNIQSWLDETNVKEEPLSEISSKFKNLKRAININTSVSAVVEKKFIQMADMLGTDWWCGLCGEYNFANITECIKCKAAKTPSE